jgi:hypothetical protein
MAAGFGLVHGLAFASALAELHLDAARLALALLGFNLGLEATLAARAGGIYAGRRTWRWLPPPGNA